MKRTATTSRMQRYLGRWSVVRSLRRRREQASTGRRWTVHILVLLVILAIVPVPWMHVIDDNPPGWAWRLDGRLVVDGEVMDPAGRWSWLTVGRPPLLIEAARDSLVGTDDPARDMRAGPIGSRPAQSEPLAAAIGMRHAGAELQLGVFVEVNGPRRDDLPEQAVIVEINAQQLGSRVDFETALRTADDVFPVTTAAGRTFEVDGPGLPYDHVRVIDIAPEGLSAAIGGPFSRLAPVAWFRSLSLGSSHGMMVALLTYAHVTGDDLARGRHIAGTGGIRGDGAVVRIGGLPAKAQAARRAGADVLFFPASQVDELAEFQAGRMVLVPIETLSDAIAYLRADVRDEGLVAR